ncbi:hypothetical protein FRC03_004626 [Tulasnella sp. 419]|nr:hypothetical protein FRC03_004626 [Tulasnella sp. 419]
MSSPRLWCYLDSSYPFHLTQALLVRSKQAPLCVSCSHEVEKEQEVAFVKIVATHLHRWKSFRIGSENYMLLESLRAEGLSAPLLERFITHHQTSGVLEIPPFVFEGSPRLRDLHIGILDCPLQTSALSQLTNLCINSNIKTHPLTMAQYEKLLSSIPFLETLFIQDPEDEEPDSSHYSLSGCKTSNGSF